MEHGSAAPVATATHDLFERHRARIHGYCLRQLGSREEAEDAVQTTFMNAFGALRKGVVPEAEAAWLFKIAENVCLSHRRSSWRRGRIESPADFGVIEEVVASPETRRDELIGIEDALAAMPTQQRRAILLREWQGLSYREIAAELELSQSAVETLIFRARRSLARGLTEPELVKPRRERRGLRKALHLGDIASFFLGAKALLGGTAAANAAVAAVTVAAVAGVTARPATEIVPDTVRIQPTPALVKPAPAARSFPPPPVYVTAEPREPVAQAPAGAQPVAAAAKPKQATAAKPAQRARPVGRTAPTRAAPAGVAAAGEKPAHAVTSPPGREVSAERPGKTGKPAATPTKPPHAATPGERARPPQAATPNKPVTPAKPVKAVKPERPEKPNQPVGTGAPPPETELPRATPPTANRPVAPPGKPEDQQLPEQAASPGAASHDPGPSADPKRGGKDAEPPPVTHES